MPEFDASLGGCEVPVGLGVIGISLLFPGGNFVDEGLFVGDAAVEALGCQGGEFGLRQVEPAAVLWGVMPFEALESESPNPFEMVEAGD